MRIVVAAVLGALMIAPATPAAAADAADRFIVAVAPDRTGVLDEGEEVAYAVEVTNRGDSGSVEIALTLPEGFEPVEAVPVADADASDGGVRWTVPVGDGETASFTATARTERAQSEPVQFKSTACARPAGTEVYEASGEDGAAAGSEACARAWERVRPTPTEAEAAARWAWWGSAAAPILVAALGIGVWWWLRRRLLRP